MKIHLLIVLLTLPLTLSAQWTKVSSPAGIPVNDIHLYNNILYAATDAGIYSYSGNAWQLRSNFNNSEAISIFDNNGTLYVGTDQSGAYRTSDGQTWTSIGNYLYSINRWYSYGGILFASTWDGLFGSVNNGDQWNIFVPVSEHGRFLSFVTCNDSLLAGTELGIYMSADSGKTWNEKTTGLALYKDVRALLKVNTTLVAGLREDGIYISTDNAKHWNPANTGLANKDIYSLFLRNDTVWAGTSDQVYFCPDISNPVWHPVNVNTYASPVKAISSWQNKLVAGNGYGVSIKNEGFQTINRGFPKRYLYQLFEMFNTLYAKTNIGFYRYQDSSDEWRCETTIPLAFSTVLPLNDSVIIAKASAAYDMIKLSTDSAKSWQTIFSTSNFINTIAVHNNYIYTALSDGTVRYSADLGHNWQTIPGNIGTIDQLIVVDTCVFADADQLYRSDNHAAWTAEGWEYARNIKLEAKDTVLYIAATNNNIYYSLYRSTDLGENFDEVIGLNAPYDGIKYTVYNSDNFSVHPSFMICLDEQNINIALDNDSSWLRFNRGYDFQDSEAYLRQAVEVKDGIYIFNSLYDIWYRSIDDLVSPAVPTNFSCSLSDNLLSATWDDNSDNESSFRIRRYLEGNDIIIPANTTEYTIDMDTILQYEFDSAFFIMADNQGDWSQFSDTVIYVIPTLVSNVKELVVQTYPNPVKRTLKIDFSGNAETPESLILSTINGSVVLRMDNPAWPAATLNLESLTNGLYMLEIRFSGGKTYKSKILKR